MSRSCPSKRSRSMKPSRSAKGSNLLARRGLFLRLERLESRDLFDAAPFELVIETKQGRERLLARAVIDASGSMLSPNPLGASGIPAIGEEASATRIAYGIPNVFADPRRYGGRTVLVVGSGHSAMNVLRDLVALKADQPATQILWAVRRRSDLDLYGGGGADALPERGRLGSVVERLVGEGAIALTTGVEIDGLERSDDGVVVHHRDGRLGPVDEIIAATGFRPELDSLRELRLALDSIVEAPTAIAPLIDPNFHSCGSVPPSSIRWSRIWTRWPTVSSCISRTQRVGRGSCCSSSRRGPARRSTTAFGRASPPRCVPTCRRATSPTRSTRWRPYRGPLRARRYRPG